jgi:GT2 family glycosyltransferase
MSSNNPKQSKFRSTATRYMQKSNQNQGYKHIIQHNNKNELVSKKIKNNKISRKTRPNPFTAQNSLLDTSDFIPTKSYQIQTPEWFTTIKKVDVSIIIPMYKSDKVIEELINSWDFQNYDFTTEIIFIDDQCPNDSKSTVVKQFAKFINQITAPIGKIFQTEQNSGFAGACNVGAFHATGDYLIFLNADTLVTKDWIAPIIKILEDEKTGIVGNLQIKKGGQWDDYIDGAGSEWHWDGLVFHHIGRHSYKFKLIDKPFHPDNCPADVIDKAREVEMVTGCCFGIRKKVFEQIGGFNLSYKIGYWEDSEICMSVKELGYKIIFTPESKIYHHLSHSNSSGHQFQNHNKNFFVNKWVKSGRIDDLVNQKRSNKPKVSSIFIRRIAASGDVLVASAVAKALKKKHPNCKIYFEAGLPDVLKKHPHIDVMVSRQNSTKIKCDVYYNLDMAYEVRPKCNILESYCQVVGVKPQDCDFSLNTSIVNDLPQDYIVIHAGYNTPWAGRQWSHANFIELTEKLKKEHQIVCIGESGDFSVPCTLNLLGKTDINQLAYVIQKAKLFVGVDSLPFHVAQFMNTPGVCFFGSIDPSTRIYRENMHPIYVKNLNCLGCHHRKPAPIVSTTICETNLSECLNNLTVEQMYQEINQRLREYNG